VNVRTVGAERRAGSGVGDRNTQPVWREFDHDVDQTVRGCVGMTDTVRHDLRCQEQSVLYDRVGYTGE
jgi:hypothetical protein